MPKTTNPLTKRSGASINIILTVIVVVVAAVVIGGVLLLNGNHNEGSSATVSADVLRKPDSHTLTQSPDNKVTVVEFLDYQCPSCAQYYKGITQRLEQDYQGRITFVTRNYPLDMHPLAVPAAKAAEAAALQGKYKEMYHAIYDNYQSWALSPDGQNVSSDAQKAGAQFDQFAQQVGLDLQRFHQDMQSPQVADRINRDKADGDQAKVQGTPTIFVNGQQFQGKPNSTAAQIDQQLRGELDKELGK
jgi:protein-disulfide isomerase